MIAGPPRPERQTAAWFVWPIKKGNIDGSKEKKTAWRNKKTVVSFASWLLNADT
jgi:hypothetical protein